MSEPAPASRRRTLAEFVAELANDTGHQKAREDARQGVLDGQDEWSRQDILDLIEKADGRG